MEYIIGSTVTNRHQTSLASDLAYSAGSIVVYYSYTNNTQLKYLIGKAPVHAVLISRDGSQIYTGEQATKSPAINVFKLDEQRELHPHMQIRGHKFGISQILEHPSQPYLVSLGSEPDKGLFVWDLRSGQKITVNKLSKHVNAIRFNENGTLLISCGYAHLKYWPFQQNGEVISQDGMMDPKSFILNEKFMYKTFVDAVVLDKVYTLTQDGMLCIFHLQTRQLDKWMDLKVNMAFSLTHINDDLICGCADGIIRIFNKQLQHITTLQKPPNLGNYNIEKGIKQLKSASSDDIYADCIAVQAYGTQMISVYSDRTMFFWDLSNIQKISVKRSFLNHSAAINDIQILKQQSSLETTFFITAGSDLTLRIWHLYEGATPPQGLRRNAYCKYLSKILYLGNSLQQFKYGSQSQNSIKCVRVSKDGNYVACGDSLGMLSIFSTKNFELVKQVQAHESEILCLDFGDYADLLASGSRDRHIAVFDEQFNKIQLLDEHTSSVTHLRFYGNKLITCSLDKSIVFREFNGQKFKMYHSEQVTKILAIDIAGTELYVTLEKRMNIYDIVTGKIKNSIETDSYFKIILADQYMGVYSEKQAKIIQNKQVIQSFTHDTLSSMAIINSKQFITTGYDGCIIVWRLSKNLKKKQLGIIGKKLKQMFQQQDLKMSKEWTINSFWIEEELKGYLSQQQDDLFKFDTDESEEDLKRPPRLENALSPLQESEFNYKNQKFDNDDMKHLQNQLQQVQTNISKLPDYKSLETKQSIIQEADPKDEQTQKEFYHDVDYQDEKQDIVVPNPSEIVHENSLKVNEPNEKDRVLSSIQNSQIFQGISRDSINLNQSYNYQPYLDETKLKEQERQSTVIQYIKQILQQTNLAQYYLRQISVELDDLSAQLTEIKDQEVLYQVLKNIDTQMADVNTRFEQLKGGVGLQQSQIREEELKKIVLDRSRDLLDNYSRMLLEHLKNNSLSK